jgi:hypothetical protein
MYQITEWRERYEVSLKGREPKDGEELRAGPLLYVRLKVYGHRQGAGYRRLHQLCGDRSLEVFGIFCKLLEISGNQPREKRGSLLNEKDEAATISDLAFIVGVTDDQAVFAVESLCQLGWISNDDTASSLKTTKHNSIQLNATAQARPRTRKHSESSGKIRERAIGGTKNEVIEEFETTFWPNVPTKVGKGKARRAYVKARKIVSNSVLITGLEKYQSYENRRKEQADYLPLHPATWLNEERWADEVQVKETAAEKVARLKEAGLL